MLSPGTHNGEVECKVEKSCFHFKEKESDHRSLCPRLFKQKKPQSNSVFTANTAPRLVEDCDEGKSLLTAGEQVIIQTALIKAMDPDQSKSEITRVLMKKSSRN